MTKEVCNSHRIAGQILRKIREECMDDKTMVEWEVVHKALSVLIDNPVKMELLYAVLSYTKNV